MPHAFTASPANRIVTMDSVSPIIDSIYPVVDAAPLKPILLFGDDLGWLAGRSELAGRKIIIAHPDADPRGMLAVEPLDGVVASFADMRKSAEILRVVQMRQPELMVMLRGDGKELTGISSACPLLPRVDSVEVLDDQIRTQLAVTAWQAKPALASLLKLITQVPTLPTIYTQITSALQSPNSSIEDIARLVAREPAVSAKLLQMVNSPLFALRGSVTSVRDATNLIGLRRLRSLVMATCLFRQFDISKCRSFSMSRFEATSLQVATWASAIAMAETRNKDVADMAFTAGMLHNFGVLLLAANIPIIYEEVLSTALKRHMSLAYSEFQTFGATHAALGGGFLASWRIPFPIVNAVGWYPFPSSSEDTAFTPLTAVHAATAVDAFAQTGMYAYDHHYMEKMGLTEKMEEWCATLPGEAMAPA